MQFPLDGPPAVPNVNAPSHIQAVIPRLTAAIINENALKHAMNPARLYVFNAITSNNFQNEYLRDAVQLGADMLSVSCAKGLYRNPDQGVIEVASNALTLYISSIVILVPELKSICGEQSQIVDGAFRNVQALNNLKQEAAALRNQSGATMYPNYPQQPMYPQQQPMYQGQAPMQGQVPMQQMVDPRTGQVVYVPVAQPQMPVMAPPPHQVLQNTAQPYQQSGAFNQYQPNASYIQQPQQDSYDRFANTPEPTPVAQPYQQQPVAQAEIVTNQPVTKKDWKSSPRQRYRTVHRSFSHKAVYSTVGTDVIEEIVPVDREKHTIGFLGGKYHLPERRVVEAIPSALELCDINANNLATAMRGETQPLNISTHIRPTMLLDVYLESALLETQRDHMQRIKGTEENPVAYRAFALIAEPHVSNTSYNDLVTELSRAKSFAELANLLKNRGAALTKLSQEGQESKADIEEYSTFCLKMDRYLTELVNGFFHHELSYPSITVGSFVDDVADIAPLLREKFDSHYESAWFRFEALVCQNLFSITEHEVESASSLVTDGSDDAVFTFIPSHYSITVVKLMAAELGYSVKSGESLMINRDLTPELYAIASSLFMHIDGLDVKPLKHVLMTQDGVKYHLHKGYLGQDCFLISKS